MSSGDRVKSLLIAHLSLQGTVPKSLQPTARLREDLGADSLDRIDLLHRVEDEFGIAISDAEIGDVRTVDDITKLVDGKLADSR